MRRLKTIILTLLAIPITVSAQDMTLCTDSMLHIKLTQKMWDNNDDRATVYHATEVFQAHAAAEGDMASYYNGWVRKIVYELDRMNIYQAYQAEQGMKKDLATKHPCRDEEFLVPNMLGQIYNQCGYIDGALREFKEAIRLVRGTKHEDGIPTLYLGMAHICIGENPKEALKWIDEEMKELNRHPDHERYYRNLANAYAFKSMAEFKLGRMADFVRSSQQSVEMEAKNTTNSHGSFLPYRVIYARAYNGDIQGALAAADSLYNRKDRLIVRSDILNYAGDHQQAIHSMRQLMHLRDSITGVMIAENIKQTEEEVQLIEARELTARKMNVILFVAIILALSFIGALIYNIRSRRRHQKELEQKNLQLNIANRKASEADRMKADFIRNISHEIRTPLNIIYGFSQVLTDPDMTADEKERHLIADAIGKNTQQITSLVNKILALSDEGARDLLAERKDVRCVAVCQEVLAVMSHLNPQHVELQFEPQVTEDAIMYTHGDSLKQMLGCLLENAVKFTEKGYIKLIVKRVSDNEICFIVEDTGCGISEEDAKNIFERFSKVDNFKQGLGLGLAYCHETSQKLGGNLTLDNTYTNGARFVLSLPIH
ncbi:MAG: HAMP domain-containing histidine kinase [Prevotella sp.]|nr:HAMP domain-containing histidine kinase [Prevotella sp.]